MAILLLDGAVDLSIDVGDRLGVDEADLSRRTLSKLAPILQELVRLWREELLSIWPVDTGRSQSSWTDRWEGLVWVLRNPVEYAEYVHNEGDPTEVWSILEALSEDLLADALPDIEGIINAQQRRDRGTGGRTRSLLGFVAKVLRARFSPRIFAAQASRFEAVSSRERTKRQLRRAA